MSRGGLSIVWTSVLYKEVLDVHCEFRIAAYFLNRILTDIIFLRSLYATYERVDTLKKHEELAKQICNPVNHFVKMT